MANITKFWELKLRMVSVAIVLLFTIFVTIRMQMSAGISILLRISIAVVTGMAIGLLIQRDTYLPFLGYAVFPPAAIVSERIPDKADLETQVTVDAPNGARVIYWGAEKEAGAVVPNPWDAYGGYSNTGVAIVREGVAKLRFQCPTQYKVGAMGTVLKRHLHYRVCCAVSGMLGPVQTKYVTCG